ncbi:tetratricopeptide repeat protein [Aestuariivirga sp.]|uniref:tetratricopeptide repeat protein n=1 Tax=Aestuariivirga sp. TaxID=2650926 RepID=UPI00391C5351
MSARGTYLTFVSALAAATLLTGCNSSGPSLDPAASLKTASTAPLSYEAVAELGKKWQAKPADVNRGLAYANGLESIGQSNQQLEVYAKLVQLNPENGKLAGLYGRKLVAAGRNPEAIPVLDRAIAAGGADWRVHSALGSAYDQQGLYSKARAEYEKALAADPQNLIVMNNLGMSYALEGNLKQAEATLRQADALPRSGSEPRIRQNLALVVGLQGRFDEASALARENLPQEQVEENMAYLRKMLSQPNTWQQISEGETQG